MAALTPDDVMCRYLVARGCSRENLEAEREHLRARIGELDEHLQAYVRWLENDVAFCLSEHGDTYGEPRRSPEPERDEWPIECEACGEVVGYRWGGGPDEWEPCQPGHAVDCEIDNDPDVGSREVV